MIPQSVTITRRISFVKSDLIRLEKVNQHLDGHVHSLNETR